MLPKQLPASEQDELAYQPECEGSGGAARFGLLLDRRRRGACLLAAWSLVAICDFRSTVQPVGVLLAETATVLMLLILGRWLDRFGVPCCGGQPSYRARRVGGCLLAASTILIPWLARGVVGLVAGTPTAWEMVMLASLGIGGLALAVRGGTARQTGLSVISSGFVMLFTTSISDRSHAIYFAVVWVMACLGWMLANHWERLEVHLAQNVRRTRGLRLGMVSLAGVVVAIAAGVSWGRLSTGHVLRQGVMPTSGGDRWADAGARSGVGDGDAVIAAKHHATSFGAVESDIFLQSHQPSLFDVFDDLIGKPKRQQKTEKAIGLVNRNQRRDRIRNAESQQGDAGFSLRRESRSKPRELADRKSSALLQWIGPAGERLAIERWDRFDGVAWTASDPATTRLAAPGLQRQEIDGKPWFFRPLASGPLVGPVRADAVKVIGLRTPRIPAPDGAIGVHVVDVDRQDFFEIAADDTLVMAGREAIPSLTTIRLVTRLLHEDRLAELRTLPKLSAIDGQERQLASTPGVELASRLAAEWTSGLNGPWQRIDTVVRTLRDEFTFDREALCDGEDPLLDFLVSRRGGDHLFATAAAVMVRALGYESRLVGGFYVPPAGRLWSGQVDIFPEAAHVWPEVLVDHGLWTAIEPTPGFMPPIRSRSLRDRLMSAMLATSLGGGMLFLGLVLLWLTRRVWGDWCCRAAWHTSFLLGDRQRVQLLVRILDTRCRLAGRQRPVGVTPREWVRQATQKLDQSIGKAAERFFDTADATFFGSGPPLVKHWLNDAERVVRGLSVRALMASQGDSSTLARSTE